MKRRRAVILGLLVVAVAAVIWQPWQGMFAWHFEFPLPATAVLLNHHHSRGLDWGHEFEFQVADDQLRDRIIEQWRLRPVTNDDEIRTWATYHDHPWWPAARLERLAERYARVDEVNTNYWSLWVDRENGRVYAEYGDW